MDIDKQVILSLIIIICIIILSKIMIISKHKAIKKLEVGLNIGNNLPLFGYEDIEGKVNVLDENSFNKIKIFFVMDSNCQECSKVISALQVIDKEYLQEVKFTFIKTRDNYNKISMQFFKKNAIFLDEDIMFNQLKINTFPFYYRVSDSGEILSKGFLSAYNIIELITNDNSYSSPYPSGS